MFGKAFSCEDSWWEWGMAVFTSSQLRAIADALADTTEGLTGPEISHLLAVFKHA